MSIFDAKSKSLVEGQLELSPLEKEISEKLAKSPFLEELDRFLEEKAAAEPWLVTCQGYDDSLRRTVRVHEDLLAIDWIETEARTLASGSRIVVNDANKSVSLHFTDYGYVPLHSHNNEKGNEDVTIDSILFIWGVILRDRMNKKWPQCRFSPVFQNLGEATFGYTVPAREWKEWF